VPEFADKLEALFNDLMTQETVPVRKRTKANCSHWDSLMQLGLVSAIEQEFGVSLTAADAIELSSFEAALEILAEKLGQEKA